ncbi:MAG: acetylxylan esterase [Tepidisphaeraceae bacterium]
MTREQMLTITPPEEPADIESFWQATYDQTRVTPLRLEVSELQSPYIDFRLRLVNFDGLGGVRLGAWLVEPTDGLIDRHVVVGHGYYNRPVEDISYAPRTAALFFGCRGLGVSRVKGISDITAFHVLHGIESKETYVHRGCVADTWSATSAMLELFPSARTFLEYRGQSFGGGIGAMALAWENRFSFARLMIPSFGHHPIRLANPCTGAGEAVRQRWKRQPVIYENTLRYFDAAAMAHRIKTPTHFACALFDPAVPPPGQFAIYNACGSEKRLTVNRTGHHNWDHTAADDAAAERDAEAMRVDVIKRLG